MTNELREIAQQIIDCETGSACWWDSDGPESGPAYAVKLARAYLAEHPADDGELIAREWLLESGFKKGLHAALQTPVGAIWWVESPMMSDGMKGMHGAHSHMLHIKTRGDVRRLLAALGIEVPK